MRHIILYIYLLTLTYTLHAAPDQAVLNSGIVPHGLNDTANRFWVTKKIIGPTLSSLNVIDSSEKVMQRWTYLRNKGAYKLSKTTADNQTALQVDFTNVSKSNNYEEFKISWASIKKYNTTSNLFGYTVAETNGNVKYTPVDCDTMYSSLVDLSNNAVVRITAKSNKRVDVRLDLIDANDRQSNAFAAHHILEGDNQWHTLEFRWDYRGDDPNNKRFDYSMLGMLDYNVGSAVDGWSSNFFDIQQGRNNAAQAFLFGKCSALMGGIVLDLAKITSIALYFDDASLANDFSLDTAKTIIIKQITVGEGSTPKNIADYLDIDSLKLKAPQTISNLLHFKKITIDSTIFSPPISTSWGDYDTDGDMDLLVASQLIKNIDQPVVMLYTYENKSFTAKKLSTVSFNNATIQWGDFNNDSKLDFIYTGQDVSVGSGQRPSVIIYQNTDTGFIPIATDITSYGSIDWKDFDADGDLDILMIDRQTTKSSSVHIYRNDNQTYIDIQADLPTVDEGSVAWGDYDNDGDLDALLSICDVQYISHIYLYKNNGNSSFSKVNTSFDDITGSIKWADFDKDGKLDIFISGRYNYNHPTTRVLKNNGNDSFTEIASDFREFNDGSFADVNNDSYLDVIISGYEGWYNGSTGTFDTIRKSLIYLNNKQGGFIQSAQLLPQLYSSAIPCDFDKDGFADLAMFNNHFTFYQNTGYSSGIVIKNQNLSMLTHQTINIDSILRLDNKSQFQYTIDNPKVATVLNGVITANNFGITDLYIRDMQQTESIDTIHIKIKSFEFKKKTQHILNKTVNLRNYLKTNINSSVQFQIANLAGQNSSITGDSLFGGNQNYLKIYAINNDNPLEKDSMNVEIDLNHLDYAYSIDSNTIELKFESTEISTLNIDDYAIITEDSLTNPIKVYDIEITEGHYIINTDKVLAANKRIFLVYKEERRLEVSRQSFGFSQSSITLFDGETIALTQYIKNIGGNIKYSFKKEQIASIDTASISITLKAQHFGSTVLYANDIYLYIKDSIKINVRPNLQIVGVQIGGSGTLLELSITGNYSLYNGIEKDFIITSNDKSKSGTKSDVTRAFRSIDKPNIIVLQLNTPIEKTESYTIDYAPHCSGTSEPLVRSSFTVNVTSSEQQNAFDDKILYPNPVSDNLHFRIPHLHTIIIYNTQGEVFKVLKIENDETCISVNYLPSGMYIFEFHSNNSVLRAKITKL